MVLKPTRMKLFFATLALSIFAFTPNLLAAGYQYDPDLATQTLQEAGVGDVDSVLNYLAARDAAYNALATVDTEGMAFALLEAFEARERVFQNARNQNGAPGSEVQQVKDYLDFATNRYGTYQTFNDSLGYGSLNAIHLETIENGDLGLGLLANAVGDCSLYVAYSFGAISSDDFMQQVKSKANAISSAIWDSGMMEWEAVAQAYFEERDKFFDQLPAGLGDTLNTHLQMQAVAFANLSKVTGLKGAEKTNDADVYIRNVSRDLVQGLYGSQQGTFDQFSYLDDRKTAFESIFNQVGDLQTAADLLDAVEYTYEDWELDLKQQQAALNGLSPTGQIQDAVDASAGVVWAGALLMGRTEFNPYPDVTYGEDFFAAFNNEVNAFNKAFQDFQANGKGDGDLKDDIKEWLRKIKRIKKTVQDVKEKLKKILEVLKKIVDTAEDLKPAVEVAKELPDILRPSWVCTVHDLLCLAEDIGDLIPEIEEWIKEICKWIKVACVILDAACEIMEIICE